MLQAIKKVLKVNCMEIVQMGGMTLGAGVLGMIALLLIMQLGKPDTYVYFGTFLAIMIAVIMYILIGMFGFAADFNQAVSMEMSRKSFAVGYYVQTTLSAALVSAIVAGIFLLERTLYKGMYAGATLDGDFGDFNLGMTQWLAVFLGAVILLPALRFILGAFVIRFQKVGLWTLWALWMLLCLTGDRILKACVHPDTPLGKACRSVLVFLQGLPEAALYAMGAGVVVLLVFGAWLLIRRQAVTCA